jgi:hypothetical protein
VSDNEDVDETGKQRRESIDVRWPTLGARSNGSREVVVVSHWQRSRGQRKRRRRGCVEKVDTGGRLQ